MPMMTRPAIRTSVFGARAATIEPAQNTATPASITFLRPSRSPTVPKLSMRPAKVRAYPFTTHCSWLTEACRSLCTLANTTVTMVLSRKVRNRTKRRVDSARALDRDRQPRSPLPADSSTACRVSLTGVGQGEGEPSDLILRCAVDAPPPNRSHRLLSARPTSAAPPDGGSYPFYPVSHRQISPETWPAHLSGWARSGTVTPDPTAPDPRVGWAVVTHTATVTWAPCRPATPCTGCRTRGAGGASHRMRAR